LKQALVAARQLPLDRQATTISMKANWLPANSSSAMSFRWPDNTRACCKASTTTTLAMQPAQF